MAQFDIKLSPHTIYNTDRNYQAIDKIRYGFRELKLISHNNQYYLELSDFQIVYKEDYSMDKEAYVFMGKSITYELIDLNLSMKSNLIYLSIENNVLYVNYNVTSIDKNIFLVLFVLDKNEFKKVI